MLSGAYVSTDVFFYDAALPPTLLTSKHAPICTPHHRRIMIAQLPHRVCSVLLDTTWRRLARQEHALSTSVTPAPLILTPTQAHLARLALR